jgi:threonine dehydrogenase-like Zn-dependent dehydrogenase
VYLELSADGLTRVDGVPDFGARGGDDVRVETAYCGVCGSDRHRLRDPEAAAGAVLGHEVVGVVDEPVADGRVDRGDPVAVAPLEPCGSCRACRRDRSDLCPNRSSLGKDRVGGFSAVVRAPVENLYPLPDRHWRYALADPLAVSMNALSAFEDLSVAADGLVVGDGTLGALTARLLAERGLEVAVAGRREEKTERACTFAGATPDAGNRSYDVAVEAVGGLQAETLETAFERTRRGGTVAVTGVFPDDRLPARVRPAFERGLRVVGVNSYRGPGDGRDDFGRAVARLSQWSTDALTTLVAPSPTAIEDALDDPRVTKPVVAFADGDD